MCLTVPFLSASVWWKASMLKRSRGVSLREDRRCITRSQSLSGLDAPPGKRQPMPTIAMGIVPSPPSGKLLSGTGAEPMVSRG